MSHEELIPVRLFTLLIISLFVFSCTTNQLLEAPGYRGINMQQAQRKAIQAYQEKDYEQAVKYYEKVLNHNQDNFIAAYNLACCYALQGDASNASKFVAMAFENGFRDIVLFFEDPDFDLVRKETEFVNLTRELRDRFRGIGKLNYVAAPSLLPYRTRIPQNYDASKEYPLLIGLHGYSGNSEGFISMYNMLNDPQVIFVAPEGQYALAQHVGPMRHSRSWALVGGDNSDLVLADKKTSEYVLNIIKQVSREHKISEVYLMGFSQGAAYAYTIGLQNSQQISGVIAFGGYLMDIDKPGSILTESDIMNGKDLRVYIAHGTEDKAINIETGRAIHKMLSSNSYKDVTLTEFDGGHEINPEAFNLAVAWVHRKHTPSQL